MQNGAMLEALYHVEHELPKLLKKKDIWKTLDITYETPRVERVWATVDGMRVNLHRIHPCSKAFFHKHPWPSAIRSHGKYEMAVGWGNGSESPPFAATIILTPGSCYEMINPDGYHYVRPLGSTSMSLMVTGKPWDAGQGATPGKGKNGSLKGKAKEEIMDFFAKTYPPK